MWPKISPKKIPYPYGEFKYLEITQKKVARKSGYNLYRGWTQTEYQNKLYTIDHKDKGT
jgi:hypothetical protein